MEYLNIYIGSWAPSSTIHLKEFYRALSFFESNTFSRREIKTWVKGLELEEIHYRPESINFIEGRFVNRIFFRVLEDGMILAGQEISDLNNDNQRLEQFLNNKLVQLWENLFNRGGSKMPKVFENIQAKNPRLVTVKDASADEMDSVFRAFKIIPYKKITLEQGEVWIGETLIVINIDALNKEETDKMIEHLLFAREYEIQLERLITVFHELWNKVEGIRSQKYLQQKELPHIHDQVLGIQNQTHFLSARLNQMRHFLNWREQLIDEYIQDPVLNLTFKRFFVSLNSSQKYLQELWSMLINYVHSTVSLITFLYSDSERKNLGTLQKLFLISVVSSILSLGSLSSVVIENALILGGLAIGLAAAIYYVLFVLLSKRRITVFKQDIDLKL